MSKTTVTTSVVIPGSHNLDDVFARVCDVTSFPEFMPMVTRVRQVTDGVSAWDIDVEGCPLAWTERDDVDHAHRVFTFQGIEGDFDLFAGSWAVERTQEGTVVTFTVSYEVGIPVIEDIIGPILQKKIKRNSLGMLHSLAADLESGQSVGSLQMAI